MQSIDEVHEPHGIGAIDVDLAQGAAVEQRDVIARGAYLGLDVSIHGGAQPAAIFAHQRPGGAVQGFQHQPFRRREQGLALWSGQGGQGHRVKGRTERGRPDLGDGHLTDRRHGGEARHVRDLALIIGHAERRVALQMLDRAHILAPGKFDILHRHIVLEVDPSAARLAKLGPCLAHRVLSAERRAIAPCRDQGVRPGFVGGEGSRGGTDG